MTTGNQRPGEQLSAAAREARERAAAGVEELRESAKARADSFSAGAGARTDHIAEAVRSAGESLRGKEDWLADAADGVGRNLERLSAAAREKGFDGIKRDAERLARERPVLFMGAAVATGLVLGRLLRSSRPRPPAERAYGEGAEMATGVASVPPQSKGGRHGTE